ncbi:MAG: DUF1385 domain-containing protein [Patescibacteria group bacterium]
MSKVDFAPGGQAVIEGVLMRSPGFVAVAVRNQSGEIIIDRRPYTSITERIRFLGLPFIRGVVGIGEMMIIGFRALNFSANIFSEVAGIGAEVQEKNQVTQEVKKETWLEKVFFGVSILVALSVSLFLFKFVPLAITTFLGSQFPFVKDHNLLFNLIDGVLKMGIFIGYIALLLKSKDMRRVFEYHGAEHKAVFTYEKKLPLTPENARIQSRFHPRCGTSFIMLVVLISVMSYTLLPRADGFLQNFLLRVAWLPVIGGLSYEFLKISAKNMENRFVRSFVTPGLWLQKLTTQEPDDAQLEVALRALESALPESSPTT